MPALFTRMSSPSKRSIAVLTMAYVGRLRHVGPHARRVQAERIGDAHRAFAVAIGDDDARALGDELPGDALAESRCRAGDDGDLSCESHARSLLVKVSASAVVDGDRLQRREAVQRLEALLAAVARVLDAAERQLDAAAGAVVVDEHLAA